MSGVREETAKTQVSWKEARFFISDSKRDWMSDSKRGRSSAGDDDLDAALSAITSKLGAATTDDHDELIALLVDVLDVTVDLRSTSGSISPG